MKIRAKIGQVYLAAKAFMGKDPSFVDEDTYHERLSKCAVCPLARESHNGDLRPFDLSDGPVTPGALESAVCGHCECPVAHLALINEKELCHAGRWTK